MFDGQAGLHQNWNRWYDPAVGGYPQSDPMGLAAGVNTYIYAMDNPLRYSDPTGMASAVSEAQAMGLLDPPPDWIRPEVKAYICKLNSRRCHGDLQCIFWFVNFVRNSNKPQSWYDPTLREAENWAYAAGWEGLDNPQTWYAGIMYWQLHKLWTRDGSTSPFSWDALLAGLDGKSHASDSPEMLEKWCRNGNCKQK